MSVAGSRACELHAESVRERDKQCAVCSSKRGGAKDKDRENEREED